MYFSTASQVSPDRSLPAGLQNIFKPAYIPGKKNSSAAGLCDIFLFLCATLQVILLYSIIHLTT